MITPALQAPLNATGPYTSSEGVDMHPWTRDLHVYPGFEGPEDPKPNQGSATTRATRTATTAATSTVAVDQPEWSAGAATVAVDQPVRPVPPFPQVKAYDEEKYMNSDRKAFTRLLLGCTTVSLAGNVAYAVERGAVTPVSIALAAVAPILLPVGVHFIPKAARVRRGARFVVTVAVIVAAVAAFVLSFEALSGLMRMRGHDGWTAYLLPVAIDVLAAAAAYALVVEPDAVREEAPVTQRVEAPAMRDAEPAPTATQTPSVRDAELATHTDATPDEPATQSDALRDADTEEIPVTCGDSRDAAAKQGTEPSTTRRLTAKQDTEPSTTQTATDRDADGDSEHLRRAELLVDAGRTTASVDVVHRVLRGKANGDSNRELAAATGITESAVQRIVKAARELEAAEPASA